jgi:hypothetical protein
VAIIHLRGSWLDCASNKSTKVLIWKMILWPLLFIYAANNDPVSVVPSTNIERRRALWSMCILFKFLDNDLVASFQH